MPETSLSSNAFIVRSVALSGRGGVYCSGVGFIVQGRPIGAGVQFIIKSFLIQLISANFPARGRGVVVLGGGYCLQVRVISIRALAIPTYGYTHIILTFSNKL